MKKQHRSQRKLLSLLLALAMLLFSSCTVAPSSANDDSTVDTIQTDAPTESTEPDYISPTFATQNSNEYEAFLQSKEFPFSLFPIDAFERFGNFSSFYTYNITSLSDFDLEYSYLDVDQVTEIGVFGREKYANVYLERYDDIYVEEVDMPENLGMSPTQYWKRISEDELEEVAYYQKYDIDSNDKYLHFKINDNIILRYRLASARNSVTVIFWYEDYVMTLFFGLGDAVNKPFELICTNPTVKSLLTKSTSKAAAEELYNLWKDALK